jgi:hypothetical protein
MLDLSSRAAETSAGRQLEVFGCGSWAAAVGVSAGCGCESGSRAPALHGGNLLAMAVSKVVRTRAPHIPASAALASWPLRK